MKTKIYILFILIMLAWLPVEVQARDFPAESLIVPADKFYQPADSVAGSGDHDGGILEAYGMIYYLLDHQDPTELAACIADYPDASEAAELAACKTATHDITVHCVINQEKTAIDGPDLIIQDFSDPPPTTPTPVVKVFNRTAGGSPTYLTPDTTDPIVADRDSDSKITYRGGVWIIDIHDLTDPALVAAEEIIRRAEWSQVKVHVAQVQFGAPIYRSMRGRPPRIALMNSVEDPTAGNAEILESYLRLGGICPDVYDVVSPNAIGGILDVDGDNNAPKYSASNPLIDDQGNLLYDFVWAPHWEGQKKYDGDVNMDSRPDVDEIVLKIREYLMAGGHLLAECASIETFEYNANGFFLTDHGFAHNGGSNDQQYVLYNDKGAPYAQIGDFDAFYVPEGGHLHNWRPFQVGVDEGKFNFATPPTEDASYRQTVTRFTVDDRAQDGVDDLDWDYYVGGYAYAQQHNGYVVYLGGHRYAECSAGNSLKFEFQSSLTNEVLHIEVIYTPSGGSQSTVELSGINLAATDWSGYMAGTVLQLDFREATINDKKLEGVVFKNLSATSLNIDRIRFTWTLDRNWAEFGWTEMTPAAQDLWAILGWTLASWDGGAQAPASENKDWNQLSAAELAAAEQLGYTEELWDEVSNQRIKKIEYKGPDGTITLLNNTVSEQPLVLNINSGDFTMAGNVVGGCSDNSDCQYSNLAGVRYVLNTLFHIKYQGGSNMYARAAPVVSHPYLYQGYYAYEPNPIDPVADELAGHFRRFKMDQAIPSNGIPEHEWDTAVDPVGGTLIPLANTDNADGRRIYTAEDDGSGNFSKLEFDVDSVAAIRDALDFTPAAETGAGEDDDEKILINQVRGKRWDSGANPQAFVDESNRLGAIMHSAPVIVSSGAKDSRFSGRPEVAYVGDLDGMLHAIRTDTGAELWAYVPSNLLGKLKNDRSDPYVYQDFPAVDGSPTARNIYYDFDHDPYNDPPQDENPTWHTILICTQGFGGKSIFALDVTNPDAWEVLWEVSFDDPDTNTPGGGMGHAFRAALDKVKVRVPRLDEYANPISGQYVDKVEWRVFVATNFDAAVGEPGGINVFSLDLRTGATKWTFSAPYTDAVDDIPGAVTTYDLDNDTFADRIYVGDMDGRLWALDANDPDPDVTGDPDRCIYTSGNDNIPLFSAGVNYPISVSPAITRHNGHVILVFGTGGAHFAGRYRTYSVYAVDATAAGLLTQSQIDQNYWDTDINAAIAAVYEHVLPQGQKVWSSPTIAVGQIWIASASGTMESANPGLDRSGEGQLQVLDMDFNSLLANNEPKTMKKVRGSLYVSNQHVYATGIDGTIIQFGNGDFSAGTGNRVVLKSWQDQ